MMEHTDLEKVKAVAMSMLNEEVVLDETVDKSIVETVGNFVTHPFFHDAVEVVKLPEGGFDGYDLLGNVADLQKAKEHKAEQINHCKSPVTICWLVRRGYRFAYFKQVVGYLSRDDMSELLHYVWTSSERTNEGRDLSLEELVELFQSCNSQALMTGEDFATFQNLPDELTIYRGVTGYNKESSYALSWTLDPEVAVKFAERFSMLNEDSGAVYEAKIKKENVLAYFSAEKEVIVIPDKLYEVQYSEEYEL